MSGELPHLETRTGGCQCGAVRYVLRTAAVEINACHCHECQKQSGSAFGLSLRAFLVDLDVSGALACYERTTEKGETTRGYFCPRCGSRLYHVWSGRPEGCTIKAGTLDDMSDLALAYHIWTDSAQPWLHLPDMPPHYPRERGRD